MRKYLTILVLLLAAMLTTHRGVAQEIVLGADFTTLFDNKEYAKLDDIASGTLFSARLTPRVGIRWQQRNELIFGVDMVQDFGHKSKFLSDANVQLYYAYRAPRLTALAGIFPRSEQRGMRTQLLFDRDYRYRNNRIGGVLMRYEGRKAENSFLEFVFDYTSMREFDSREAFTLMLSGEVEVSSLYLGVDLMLGHYAKDYNPATEDGVVDNAFALPYLGYRPSFGGFEMDLRLSYMQAVQRDRIAREGWQMPRGGELYLAISRWGITLANRLYVGKSLFPFWDKYGQELYFGTPHYATSGGIYEAVEVCYRRAFFSDTVRLGAGITAEYDGTGWGTRQWVELGVVLDYGIALKVKH